MGFLPNFKKFSNLFGRKSITVADKVAGWSLMGLTQGAQNFRSTREQLEAVRKLGHVATCVKLIGQKLAHIESAVIVGKGKAAKTVTDANLLKLLEQPNPYQSGYEFTNMWVWHLLLSGNAIVLCTADDMLAVKDGRVQSMWLLDPSKVEIEIENEVNIKEYRYRDGGIVINLPKELIFHARLPNPQSRFWGLGVISQDQLLFDGAFSAKLFNYNFFANGAMLAGYLSTDQPMDAEPASELLEAFKRLYGGSKNQQKTALFHSGIKYQPLASNQNDMAFGELSKMAREDIFSLFGVPLAIVGLDPAAQNKIGELVELYHENTINPLRLHYQQFMTTIVRRFFNKQWSYWMAEVVTSKKEKLRSEARGLVQDGIMNRNEARNLFDLDQSEDPAMNQFTVGFNTIPIGELSMANQPALPAEAGTASLEEIEKKKIEIGAKASGMAAIRKMLFMSQRDKKRMYPRFEKSMAKFWKAQEARILANLDDMGKSLEYDVKKAFNQKTEDEILVKILMPDHTASIMIAAEGMGKFTGLKFDNTTQNPAIVAAIRKVSAKISNPGRQAGINNTTREKVTAIISRGTEAGATVEEMKREIKEMFDSFTDGEAVTNPRARMIARTEASIAYDAGSAEVYKELGYENFGVFGCEDEVGMCNARNVTLEEIEEEGLHPNHTGTTLPMPGEFDRLLQG